MSDHGTAPQIASYRTVFETLRGIPELLSPDDFSYRIDFDKNEIIPDTVIHLSCMASYTPGLPYLAHKILEKIGVANVVLGGPENCCGEIQRYAHDDDLAERNTRITMYTFQASRAIRVASICPDCVQVFKAHNIAKFKFNYSGISAIFAEHLSDLVKHYNPVPLRIGLHGHNANAESLQDNINIATVLNAIPGLQIVRLEHEISGGVHCQMFDMMTDSFKRGLYEEVEDKRLDALVMPYHSCYRQHIPGQIGKKFAILHYFHIMAKALAIPYTEPFKELRLLGSVGKAMEILEPKIKRLGLDPDTVRTEIAGTIFSGR